MLFSTIAFEPLLHHSRCVGADLVLRFEVDSLRLQGAMIDARIDIERDEPFVDMLRPGLAPMGQQFGAVPITDLGTELGRSVFADADLAHRQHDMRVRPRSEEHTSELQSLMRNSYAVFCLTKKKHH